MSGIKVTDLAYARIAAPDLDQAEEFLQHFGLITVEKTASKLFLRGTGSAHHIYIAEKGAPRFIGAGFYASSAEDLELAARLPSAVSGVEPIDEPGGGSRVRLKEPNGYQIEVVHGIEQLPEIETYEQAINTGARPLNRKGELLRVPKGPLPVLRIAHVVFATPKFAETLEWFRSNLGFIGSDDVYAGEKENVIASFNRCDCGDDYVDHHTLAIANVGELTGLHHISFEVPTIDTVMADHDYLKQLNKYEHQWGVGRHNLGSQVFDYWFDPWGRIHEHWADSDRLNASDGTELVPVEDLASQWGEPQPETFLAKISP